METLRDQLIRHEGLHLKPYRDSEGILTIGVGRNLEQGITADEAEYLLDNDIRRHRAELLQKFPVVAKLDHGRQAVLINMAFNLGLPRLARFSRMWAAIYRRDWQEAAREMLDSKWARQVKGRATELADQMRNG